MNESTAQLPGVDEKIIGKKDIVLYSVSAILLLDTLTASASLGPSSIFWWLCLGVLFYLPMAMICAEMGCAYPEHGGIYAWVRNAFGGRWGSRISWSYWVNVAIWMPAIYIMFAGVFKQLFFPSMDATDQIIMGILLAWISVGVNVMALDIGKWVPNIGAIFKMVVFITISYGAYDYVSEHGMANPINLDSMAPDWVGSLQFIPAIIYGMLGFELVSASANNMKNPGRDIPSSILLSGIIIFVLYVLGTVSILAALPAGDIDLLEGLIDTLMLFFGGSTLGNTFVIALGVMALYTFFSNGVTWAMGGNRAAAEAAIEGELPRVFGVESKKQTPVGASIIMGVSSTVILILYGFLVDSNEDLFWSLFAFSGVIFLLPYVGMLLAFIKLRLRDGEHYRPYKIPGNNTFASLLAVVCIAILILSITLFIYVPGEGVQWPVLIGTLFALLIGELAIRYAETQKNETQLNC
ncbi:APC family permease [Maricurvus nonylphenolicus]|uniref:APC family permease n=1 Tax=Maricurvus nonylphenolicus TaxID=1008307 RepID=UPI0036F30961